jgi:ActR/RegA family two-component response regulator
VPDSAYFAAHEAAKGVGDALLAYAKRPTPDEVALATRRYRSALAIFPFDRRLWPALASALERQGREPEYLDLVRPVADWVTRSRSIDGWIAKAEPGAEAIASLRRALSESLVIVYLGFAEETAVEAIEQSVRELRAERERVAARLAELEQARGAGGAAVVAVAGPAAPAEAPPAAPDPLAWDDLGRSLAETSAQLEKLDLQIAARSRALPLFEATFDSGELAAELRAQRGHPVHALLRRMYHEKRS